jgi:hypothetical protein
MDFSPAPVFVLEHVVLITIARAGKQDYIGVKVANILTLTVIFIALILLLIHA